MIAKKSAKKKVGLLESLEDSLTNILADIDSKNPKSVYSLTDKCKVYDRILKLESLKKGIDDNDDTSGFEDD